MHVLKRSGVREPLDPRKYERQIEWSCAGIQGVDAKTLKRQARQPLYDGITTKDLNMNLRLTAVDLATEKEPNWTFVAAKFVLQDLYKEVSGDFSYPSLRSYLERAAHKANVAITLLGTFDLDALNAAIDSSRDFKFDYLGITTVAERYLLRDRDTQMIIEMPQHWLMRVAMGVARDETTIEARTAAALSYYEGLSTFEFMSSTPTLFNAGLNRSQLSSCFGISMGDDFDKIWDSLRESAAYSKYGGGIAMDYTSIRARGSPIRSMGGEAGGPIPYIKLLNDALIGFDQQGKRKGSGAVYLEPWHADINAFLELREPGEDRLRAHDVFPALWIPDLFMRRVLAGEYWSLFDPLTVPDLHDLYGPAFDARYAEYESQGLAKEMVLAEDLWYKMITRVFAHGVYWQCFKDRMNVRYAMPDTIRSSNLCTEIALRSNDEVSFVCNLGSLNLGHDDFLLKRHSGVSDVSYKYEWNQKLERAVRRSVRFLDSVISVGYVPSERGRRMQEEDRPLGMGCMGWTVALYKMGIDYESSEHVEYANEVWKQIGITAADESANLARERGSFPRFAESKWAQGILTHQTLDMRKVVDEFGLDLSFANCPFTTEEALQEKVRGGMRNSTLTAIAPTATISNIIGTEACTELPWALVFDKKNLSGIFKAVAKIAVNNRYGMKVKTAFEVDHLWTIRAAAARQIWIDQSQSTNFFVDTNKPNFGDVGVDLYRNAWEYGLKATYYMYGQSEETKAVAQTTPLDHFPETPPADAPACFLRPGDPGFSDCEACQ